MTPHILLVTPRLCYPAASGAERRVYALLKRLAGRYRFSLLTFIEPRNRARSMAAAMSLENTLLHRVHVVEKGFARPRWAGAWMPPEFHDYASRELSTALSGILDRESVDLVHLEFSEMAQYARGIRGRIPVVLTEHDTSLLSWGRSYMTQAGWLGTMRRPWDWTRQWLYEWSVLRHCDRVVVVSEADRRRLASLIPAGRIQAVPTGVDLELFPPQQDSGRAGDTLLFIGHYPHFPNEDAAVTLCRDILPRVRRDISSARLLLVGSSPTQRVRNLASEFVEVVGTVPRVQPYLARARVFVAPLRLGFGIKGKLLEAFASGIPVVATPQACEGIPQAWHGEHLLVAHGPDTFAGEVRRLLHDPLLRRRLAANARTLVEEHYAWDRQADRLDRLYQELLGRARPEPALPLARYEPA